MNNYLMYNENVIAILSIKFLNSELRSVVIPYCDQNLETCFPVLVQYFTLFLAFSSKVISSLVIITSHLVHCVAITTVDRAKSVRL